MDLALANKTRWFESESMYGHNMVMRGIDHSWHYAMSPTLGHAYIPY